MRKFAQRNFLSRDSVEGISLYSQLLHILPEARTYPYNSQTISELIQNKTTILVKLVHGGSIGDYSELLPVAQISKVVVEHPERNFELTC